MNKRFIMIYSMGKDSTLALHKMIDKGYEAAVMLVFYDKLTAKSFMHQFSMEYIGQYRDYLSIPVEIVGMNQTRDLASAVRNLVRMKVKYDADIVVTGDIDQQPIIRWNKKVAALADIQLEMPLLGMNHEQSVHEVLEAGYKCVIISIADVLPRTLLGKPLNEKTLEVIQKSGCDICGEDGTYNTMVVDGPIFKSEINYSLGEVEKIGVHSVVNVMLK